MLPLAIPAIASLAGSAIQTLNDIANTRAAAKAQQAQPTADFLALLQKAAAAGGTGAAAANPLGAQDIQRQLAALPEIKSALGASVPGTQLNFTVSPGGDLFQMLPNGGQQQLALSPQSQALFRQWAAAAQPGCTATFGLVA